MSYISAIRIKDEVLVWERTEKGRETSTFPAPYNFYIHSPTGEYNNIYGDKLQQLTFRNSFLFNQKRDQLKRKGVDVFESDIPPELKVISEHYYGLPAPKLNVTFFDIEVAFNKQIGYASIENPYAEICSVALYHQWEQKFVVLTVPPEGFEYEPGQGPPTFFNKINDITPLPKTPVTTDIQFCRSEKELLLMLLTEIEDSDVLSGWNSQLFDLPYIGKRLQLILGRKYFNMLSFPEGRSPQYRKVNILNIEHEVLDLSGRFELDYLQIFKKYEVAERPSYKLEAIAEEVLPELPKLTYQGSLTDLYQRDFPYFVRYNLRDTEILKGFEERLAYIELANQMYHLSGGLAKHITGTLKLAEYATINYCHHKLGGLIVNDNNIDFDEEDRIQGATVLEPKVGMHKWFGSVDVNSLYPCSIRAINISPEMIRGQFDEQVNAAEQIAKRSLVELTFTHEDTQQKERHTAEQWREIFKKQNWAVSGFGTVFDQTSKGIIPSILEDWYMQRKEYQKKKSEAKDKLTADYYNRLQYVYKIKLNSFYGALTNGFFRFFDLRMGESTTGTGRMILQHQCAKVNQVLTGEYDFTGESIIYGDSVAGTTVIETLNGPLQIKNLFQDVSYTIGDRQYSNNDSSVLTYNPTTTTNEFKQIKYVMRHKSDKKMYRVWVGNLRYVDVTEDHSLIGYANTKIKTPGLVTIKPTEIGINNVNCLLLMASIPSTSSSLNRNTQHCLEQSGYVLITPTKVEEIPYDDYVYDIEVEDTHTFYANGLLVHNTDSSYFKTFTDNEQEAIKVADAVASVVNESFPEFMRETFLCLPGFDSLIKTGRELVSDCGIFVDKKRYILHVVNVEGKSVDKMKIMGIDTKKTTLPREIAKDLNRFIERLLKGENWDVIAKDIVQYKEDLQKTTDIMKIGLPKGIKGIEAYVIKHNKDPNTRLPGHVAAGMFYNKCLETFNDKQSIPINTGMKIKVFYLKTKVDGFKSIAIPVDIEQVPQWFLDQFEIDKDAHIERLVDKPLLNILKAIDKVAPSKQSLIIDSLLEF